MALNFLDEHSYLINEYLEISDFDTLCNIFLDVPYVDKYMISAFVAYLEGHIIVDLNTNLWYLSSFKKILILHNNVEPSYFFISIYNYIKSNEVFYDFIIKYFNLWHGKENACFQYDKFHKNELINNFKNMIYLINHDINSLEQDENNKKYINMFNSLLDVVFA